jgi:hypothetical protein
MEKTLEREHVWKRELFFSPAAQRNLFPYKS